MDRWPFTIIEGTTQEINFDRMESLAGQPNIGTYYIPAETKTKDNETKRIASSLDSINNPVLPKSEYKGRIFLFFCDLRSFLLWTNKFKILVEIKLVSLFFSFLSLYLLLVSGVYGDLWLTQVWLVSQTNLECIFSSQQSEDENQNISKNLNP